MKHKKLIVAVCSHRGSHLRNLAREGWIKRWGSHPDIEWFFYVGNTDSDTNLTEPNVVNLNCRDDYDALPQKSRALFNYVHQNYTFEWLFKCDDDTWVHIPRLLSLDKSQSHYIGDNHGYRCRKWYNNGLPDYGHGGSGYLLSPHATYIVSQTIHPMTTGCEDLVVGKILYEHGIHLKDEARLQYDYNAALVPKPTNEMISIHYVNTPTRLQTIESYWK
jgi:hypothetical protein